MKLETQNIVILGSPEFVLPSLEKIHAHTRCNIKGILTQSDSKKGRGLELSPSPVKAWALSQNISCFTPETKSEVTKCLKELNPSLIIVIAYGKILEKEITDTYFCINAHASLLPQYRGASPIHSSLLNQDKKTGITLIHMNEKMDEGNILSLTELIIENSDTLKTLHDKLALMAGEALISLIEASEITETPQDHTKATYCKKLTTADRELKETDSINLKLGKIKAFSPIPGAFIQKGHKSIKILEALLEENLLKPVIVKPEGKKEMHYEDYLKGYKEEIIL